ncbi:unnamed protein product [Staurois parvus]|uniref:Uncharacterized protein n=1 Tax=Staurois parvus TaxID=386267 RepID=A0ABN9FGN5_9NEOB|nr:unnamed protein product [Staurois parvus]
MISPPLVHYTHTNRDTGAHTQTCTHTQGRTDNSWGPRAIGDHGALVSLPKLKKAYKNGTRIISWGPLLILGPRAVPEFPNGQSAPHTHRHMYTHIQIHTHTNTHTHTHVHTHMQIHTHTLL